MFQTATCQGRTQMSLLNAKLITAFLASFCSYVTDSLVLTDSTPDGRER